MTVVPDTSSCGSSHELYWNFWRLISRAPPCVALKVERLHTGDLSKPFRVPSRGTFAVDAVLLPLWKKAVSSLSDQKRIASASASKIDLGSKAELIETLMLPSEEAVNAAVAQLKKGSFARECAKIDAMGPRLPEARKAALLGAARTHADEMVSTLLRLRERFLSMADGGALLLQLARSVRDGRGHAQSAQDGRGAEHELHALAWARAHWPPTRGYVIIANSTVTTVDPATYPRDECRPPSPLRRQSSGRGLKQEFDVLVARSSRSRAPDQVPDHEEVLELMAVVEAKAGEALFADLPKLLEAREHFFPPGATVRVRGVSGPNGAGARCHVLRVGPDPVHLCYLFGRAPESLATLAMASATTVARHVLLDRELCRPCPSLTFVHERSGPAVHAVFEDLGAIADVQASVERFCEQAAALVESGELSCWRVVRSDKGWG